MAIIATAHKDAVISKCQYDCRSGCSEVYCACNNESTSSVCCDAMTGNFIASSCLTGAVVISSRSRTSWSVRIDALSSTNM